MQQILQLLLIILFVVYKILKCKWCFCEKAARTYREKVDCNVDVLYITYYDSKV